MRDISAIALFCDDVREEKSGAYSLIGVVGDNISVPSFPGAIPKLAIYIRINIAVDSDPCELRIFLNYPNGETLLVSTIEESLIRKTVATAAKEGNSIAGVYSHLIAAPFPVSEAGRIRVELTTDSGSEVIGGLNFVAVENTINAPPHLASN